MSAKLRLVALIALLPLGGCEWFSDFKRQPAIYPWDSPDTLTASRGNPQGSVPISGMAVSGLEVSYSGMPTTVDSMSGLANPTPATAASLANGRMYYQINCAVCHGDRGMGDGPVTKYGMPGIGIAGDATRARSDGYIYGMIRNGRGMMPTYNRIEEMDRWDVVNYVRALQGGPGAGVPTGQLAVPGFNGPAVPGATTMGPTRPAPHTAAQMQSLTGARDSVARDTTTRSGTDTTAGGARAAAPRQGERE